MTTATTARPVEQADALFMNCVFAGYQEGTPPFLSPAAREVDMETVARMRCPGCRRRGLKFVPFHKPGSYRVLAECQTCGAGEIV